jgi:hypothetical protein
MNKNTVGEYLRAEKAERRADRLGVGAFFTTTKLATRLKAAFDMLQSDKVFFEAARLVADHADMRGGSGVSEVGSDAASLAIIRDRDKELTKVAQDRKIKKGPRTSSHKLRAYAKQKKDHELHRWMGEIFCRATLRYGELSKAEKKAKAGRPPKNGSHRGDILPGKRKAIAASGLSKSVAQLDDRQMLQYMGRENGEDYHSDFTVMLNTWEGAVRFLTNSKDSPKSERILSGKLLDIAITLGKAR